MPFRQISLNNEQEINLIQIYQNLERKKTNSIDVNSQNRPTFLPIHEMKLIEKLTFSLASVEMVSKVPLN